MNGKVAIGDIVLQIDIRPSDSNGTIFYAKLKDSYFALT